MSPETIKSRRGARQIASEIIWERGPMPPSFLLPDGTIRLGDTFRVIRIETDEDGTTYTMEHEPGESERIGTS